MGNKRSFSLALSRTGQLSTAEVRMMVVTKVVRDFLDKRRVESEGRELDVGKPLCDKYWPSGDWGVQQSVTKHIMFELCRTFTGEFDY